MVRLALMAAAACAATVASAPAAAVALVQSYTVQSPYNLRHGISFNTYGDGGLGLTSSYDIPAPGGEVRDPFDKDSDNPPLLTTLMATSDLSGVATAAASAVQAIHLVVGFNTRYAAGLLAGGRDFGQTFHGFDEAALIHALDVLDSSADEDARGAAGGLIVDFSSRVRDLGGLTDANGGALTFLSFSNPTYAGSGSAKLTPVPSTPSVPEPASWALMLGGFGLVGVALRRRPRVAMAAA